MTWKVYEIPYGMPIATVSKYIAQKDIYSDVYGFIFEGYVFVKDNQVLKGLKYIGIVKDSELPIRNNETFFGSAKYTHGGLSIPIVVIRQEGQGESLIWRSGFLGGLSVVNSNQLSAGVEIKIQDSVLLIDIEKLFFDMSGGMQILEHIMNLTMDYNPTSIFIVLPYSPLQHIDYTWVCKILYYCGMLMNFSDTDTSNRLSLLSYLFQDYDVIQAGSSILSKEKIFLDKSFWSSYIIDKELIQSQGYLCTYPDKDIIWEILESVDSIAIYSRLSRFFQ